MILLKVIQALSNKVDGLDPIQEYGAGDITRVPFICDEYDTKGNHDTKLILVESKKIEEDPGH